VSILNPVEIMESPSIRAAEIASANATAKILVWIVAWKNVVPIKRYGMKLSIENM
jgi:hypothetical protein